MSQHWPELPAFGAPPSGVRVRLRENSLRLTVRPHLPLRLATWAICLAVVVFVGGNVVPALRGEHGFWPRQDPPIFVALTAPFLVLAIGLALQRTSIRLDARAVRVNALLWPVPLPAVVPTSGITELTMRVAAHQADWPNPRVGVVVRLEHATTAVVVFSGYAEDQALFVYRVLRDCLPAATGRADLACSH